MKQTIASVVVLVVLVLVLAGTACAVDTQPNWRVYFIATDTNKQNALGDMTVGVYSSSKDGFGVDGTASDSQDARAALSSASVRAVVGVFDGKAWIRHVESNSIPPDSKYVSYGGVKPWDLRVAGLGSASTLDTVLTIKFVSPAAGIPPQTLSYGGNTIPAFYYLKMVDNQGVQGAPANGTVWAIPFPATWQTATIFSLTLPTFNIPVAKDEASLLASGYKMQFYQTPEPSSLLALAGGIMGMVGYHVRRRRA